MYKVYFLQTMQNIKLSIPNVSDIVQNWSTEAIKTC